MRYLPAIAIVMLLANCVYLGRTVANEIRAYKARRDSSEYLPRDGSLNGIATDGKIVSAGGGAHAPLQGEGYLLLFVIDAAKGMEDIRHWNNVIQTATAALHPGGRSIQYWGICNAADACNQYQPFASFRIVAFLDPYQMHIVAKTIQDRGALLYDPVMTLRSHIPSSNDPSLQASLFLKHLKE